VANLKRLKEARDTLLGRRDEVAGLILTKVPELDETRSGVTNGPSRAPGRSGMVLRAGA